MFSVLIYVKPYTDSFFAWNTKDNTTDCQEMKNTIVYMRGGRNFNVRKKANHE